MMRLSQVARILNVGIATIVDHLSAKGFEVTASPNTKIDSEQIEFLAKDFNSSELLEKSAPPKATEQAVAEPAKKEENVKSDFDEILYFRSTPTPKPAEVPVVSPPAEAPKEPLIEHKLPGIKVVGKLDLSAPKPSIVPLAPVEETPVASESKKEEAVPVVEEKVVATPVVEEVAAELPTEPAVISEPTPPAAEKEAQEELPAGDSSTETFQPESVQEEEKVESETASRVEAIPPVEAVVQVLPSEPAEPELIEAKGEQLRGLKVVGKIELPVERGRKKEGAPAVADSEDKKRKRKRKRIRENSTDTPTATPPTATAAPAAKANTNKPATAPAPADTKKGTRRRGDRREEVSDKEVADSIKATMARMGGNATRTGKGAKRRRDRSAGDDYNLPDEEETKVLRVTEFISANELATLMEVSVQEVISVCLSMGMFVSINQRLDAEAITFIADEFGYEVQFVSAEEEVQSEISEEVDTEEDLLERAPIVTIMGHVDHGKTSLLDYIRQANVAGGEAGGITQHIGAYNVKTKTGKQVTFLDTPGHEAFTAMRARGAKVTDVVIIVIAADDSVMPQTREAINHAQVAGVPIVFAFSKVDKPGANTEKIREELANMNLLVEDWGGKYQSQEISSKSGLGIEELLEKVLLEAEMLELKANPNRRAVGTVVEAALDKGRGYVATILVQTGTLKVGDILLAGAHYGRVKAMTDYLGKRLKQAGPSMPVQVLGLNGAPQAGDKINVMENERDARDIANKREQLLREQSMRTRRHITLEEIGRRKAIGTFKELNLIIKGDVDGSVEALSDSLLQLSTDEIQVNIIHKAVGQISESDVNLAIASDAIIVGFQVRPSANAKKMAEQDQIEIRHYSVIYQAIDEIKDAMTGMLAPTVEEFVTGNIEIRETFKISRVGTIAGCYVTDGFVKRNNKIRIIRDGIVLHTGEIDSLKRYKDDVTEVRSGYECGLNIKNFNDIEQGDIIESFELREIKRTL